MMMAAEVQLSLTLLLLFLSLFHAFRRCSSETSSVKDEEVEDEKMIIKKTLASVQATDELLRQLAANEIDDDSEFVHPNAKRTAGGPQGPKMNSAREMATVSQPPTIDIERPCVGDFGGGGGAHLTLVVFVYVRVADFARRRTIRETYGSVLRANPRTVLYFVLARAVTDDTRLEAQLRNESLHHGDLLQFAFTDDYYNLTLKTVATVRWTALHCSRARFAFKLDDDAYLRVNRLLDTVDRLPSQSQPPVATIFGDLQDTLPVEHNFSSDYRTWAIDRQYWPYQVYPNYTNGMYLLPAGGCDRLYRAVVEPPTTDTIPALPIEDTYMTGVVAEKAGVPRVHIAGIRQLYGDDKHNLSLLADSFVFFELDDDDLRRFWRIYGPD